MNTLEKDNQEINEVEVEILDKKDNKITVSRKYIIGNSIIVGVLCIAVFLLGISSVIGGHRGGPEGREIHREVITQSQNSNGQEQVNQGGRNGHMAPPTEQVNMNNVTPPSDSTQNQTNSNSQTTTTTSK